MSVQHTIPTHEPLPTAGTFDPQEVNGDGLGLADSIRRGVGRSLTSALILAGAANILAGCSDSSALEPAPTTVGAPASPNVSHSTEPATTNSPESPLASPSASISPTAIPSPTIPKESSSSTTSPSPEATPSTEAGQINLHPANEGRGETIDEYVESFKIKYDPNMTYGELLKKLSANLTAYANAGLFCGDKYPELNSNQHGDMTDYTMLERLTETLTNKFDERIIPIMVSSTPSGIQYEATLNALREETIKRSFNASAVYDKAEYTPYVWVAALEIAPENLSEVGSDRQIGRLQEGGILTLNIIEHKRDNNGDVFLGQSTQNARTPGWLVLRLEDGALKIQKLEERKP